jgi:YaiO family outer membrane protein
VALWKKVVPRVLSLLTTICLSVALTASAQNQAADRRAEAERLANSGAYAEALKAFQAIAAANPDDFEARMGIARMYEKLGQPEHASDVYRSILATQPQNLDALIGAGTALVSLGRLGEAADVLNRAEAMAKDRPAVLLAQGHLHEAANRTTLALAYYERAIALDPSNAAARQAAAELRARRAHRVEVDYDFQKFDFDGSAPHDTLHLGTFDLNGRVADQLRVFARVQAQHGFDSDEQRAGGGIEWAVTRNTEIRVGALAGFDTTVLPDTDAFFGASVRAGRARWSFDVQGADFDDANLWIFGPGVAIALPHSGELSIRYYHGRVTTDVDPNVIATDTVALSLQGHIAKRAWASVGYTHGIDRLDWLTLDRIGFEADTASFRVGFDFTPFATLETGYDFQSRPDNVRVHRARVGLIYRF